MSKKLKLVLGILTLWITLSPVFFVVLWLGTFFPMILMSESQSATDPSPLLFMMPFMAFFIGILCTKFIQTGMQVFYLIHIIRNTHATEILRILIGVGLFFLPFVAMPIYFLTFIWPEKPPLWAVVAPSNPQAPGA
jgi:hypothetical protein